MTVSEKPAAYRHAHATKNQKLVPNDQRRQNHERQTANRNRRTGRHATDEQLQGWEEVGRKTKRQGKMVGATGFEPATSWTQTTRSSQAELRSDNARMIARITARAMRISKMNCELRRRVHLDAATAGKPCGTRRLRNDQARDSSKRKGNSLVEMEHWLDPWLNYTPD